MSVNNKTAAQSPEELKLSQEEMEKVAGGDGRGSPSGKSGGPAYLDENLKNTAPIL